MYASKLKFWIKSNRIGPDMPLTHIFFYSKRLGNWWATKKLKRLGVGAEIRPHAYLVETKNISLGRNVVIRPGTMFFAVVTADGSGDIAVEDNVLIGSGVHVYVSNHRFDDHDTDIFFQGHAPPKPVLIKQGAWIGACAVILPGVIIGRNAVVGAGSVVTKSVPDFSVVAGAPAKAIKK